MADQARATRRLHMLTEDWFRRLDALRHEIGLEDDKTQAAFAPALNALRHKLDEAVTKIEGMRVARPERFRLGEMAALRALDQTAAAFASLERRMRLEGARG